MTSMRAGYLSRKARMTPAEAAASNAPPSVVGMARSQLRLPRREERNDDDDDESAVGVVLRLNGSRSGFCRPSIWEWLELDSTVDA